MNETTHRHMPLDKSLRDNQNTSQACGWCGNLPKELENVNGNWRNGNQKGRIAAPCGKILFGSAM